MANEGLYNKIVYKSNLFYNDALKKAQVRDLTGAVSALKECLALNKKNTDARNLLGLVYFETGETVKALSQWIISRNNDPSKDNAALYYIDKVQSNQSELDKINQTIKKYNQALQYTYQGSYDLALIQLKKVLSINEHLIPAYQLLSLIYMETGEHEKARRTIVKGLRIDRTNTVLFHYLEETDEVLREIDMSQDGKKKPSKGVPTDILSYESGNDTIIQPVHDKERAGFSSVVNILIGIIVGMAVCYFLILPARIEKKTQEFDAMYIEVSDELSEEQAQHRQDLAALDEVKADNDRLNEDLKKAEGKGGYVRPEDYIIQAALAYTSDTGGSQKLMELLEKITEEEVENETPEFQALYDRLVGNASPEVTSLYVEAAKAAMKANDYEEAITQYEKAYELNKSDSDILMNLAHAYRQNGDFEKANELYRKVTSDFPETQNAQDALEYITDENE